MIQLLSKKTSQLSKKEINSICLLKDTEWRFGIKSQLNWFNKNIKSLDVHNMLIIDNELVGYTLLRIRKVKSVSVTKYLLFDTLIISKKFRKKKLSNLIMIFNNEIIKQSNKLSFLICNDELIGYYQKYEWTKLNKNKFKIMDHQFNSNGMIFNNYRKFKYLNFYMNKL